MSGCREGSSLQRARRIRLGHPGSQWPRDWLRASCLIHGHARPTGGACTERGRQTRWTPSVITPTLTTAPVRNPSPGGDGSGTALSLPPLITPPARKNPSSDGGSSPDGSMSPREVPSVLPVSQDYFKPVAAASTAHVVTKALERDTPSGRTVITIAAMTAAALTGNHIAGKEGALVGAGLSLLIAGLMYRPQGEPSSSQPVLRRLAPQAAVLAPARPPIRVGHASTPRGCALMPGSGAPDSHRRGTVVEAPVEAPQYPLLHLRK